MKNQNEKPDPSDNNQYIEIFKTNNYGLTQLNTIIYDMNKIEEKLLNYYLYKIKCELKKNHGIIGLKLIYKNRNDNKKIDVINIPAKKKASLEQEYTFDPSENILEIRLWLKDKLIGFEITTDKGEIKKFGYGENEQLVNIPDLQQRDKVVVGFEIGADDKDGITSMCSYYIDRNKYTALLNIGAIYLKIKLRSDEYKNKIEKKLGGLDEKFKILYRVCLLPNHPFFEIMKYMIN